MALSNDSLDNPIVKEHLNWLRNMLPSERVKSDEKDFNNSPIEKFYLNRTRSLKNRDIFCLIDEIEKFFNKISSVEKDKILLEFIAIKKIWNDT